MVSRVLCVSTLYLSHSCAVFVCLKILVNKDQIHPFQSLYPVEINFDVVHPRSLLSTSSKTSPASQTTEMATPDLISSDLEHLDLGDVEDTKSMNAESHSSEDSYQQPVSVLVPEGQKWYVPYVPWGHEPMSHYKPGGFHPLYPTNIIDGRFEVVYKLGYGGVGTVWLCYELEAKKWRAIKVNRASRSSEDCPDVKLTELMKDGSAEEFEANHIVTPLETFWVDGPNGRHFCSVMPIMGPPINLWRFWLGTNVERVKEVCYQITKALSYLHSKGICHGDFRSNNILFKFKDGCLDHIGKEELRDQLLPDPDRVMPAAVEEDIAPHLPKWIVESMDWDNLDGSLVDMMSDEIAIIDFGEAYNTSSPPPFGELGIPMKFAAPEVTYGGYAPGPGSDIWSLAYTLLEFRLGESYLGDFIHTLARMERWIGPMPMPFRHAAQDKVYEFQMAEFESNGEEHTKKPKPIVRDATAEGGTERVTDVLVVTGEADDWAALDSPYTDPLEIAVSIEIEPENFKSDEGSPARPQPPLPQNTESGVWISPPGIIMPEAEVKEFADLLRQMFKYNPAERISAEKILEHPWFRNQHQAALAAEKGVATTAGEKPTEDKEVEKEGPHMPDPEVSETKDADAPKQKDEKISESRDEDPPETVFDNALSQRIPSSSLMWSCAAAAILLAILLWVLLRSQSECSSWSIAGVRLGAPCRALVIQV
ncbi:kinase-like domain-containing protein [Xylariomycetidae sp. FL2044]|nr:kinase-like domain-containing protein [Xylariomycetidae sp. FL2044]